LCSPDDKGEGKKTEGINHSILKKLNLEGRAIGRWTSEKKKRKVVFNLYGTKIWGGGGGAGERERRRKGHLGYTLQPSGVSWALQRPFTGKRAVLKKKRKTISKII